MPKRLLSCEHVTVYASLSHSPSQVLLADEPTSNVDLELDVRVHRMLLELDATVMMICHRLQVPADREGGAMVEGGRGHRTLGQPLDVFLP